MLRAPTFVSRSVAPQDGPRTNPVPRVLRAWILRAEAHRTHPPVARLILHNTPRQTLTLTSDQHTTLATVSVEAIRYVGGKSNIQDDKI